MGHGKRNAVGMVLGGSVRWQFMAYLSLGCGPRVGTWVLWGMLPCIQTLQTLCPMIFLLYNLSD